MSVNRRTVLTAAAGMGALAMASESVAAGAAKSAHFSTLKALISAWKAHDVEGTLKFLTDDIVWQTGGHDPVIRGKANLRGLLEMIAAKVKESRWRVFHHCESGDLLFVEGVDEYISHDGIRKPIPYAGVIRFRDGLISEWREYYDGRLLAGFKEGEPLPDSITSLIDRPAE